MWEAYGLATQERRGDLWEGPCGFSSRRSDGLGKQGDELFKMLWLLEVGERQEQMVPS